MTHLKFMFYSKLIKSALFLFLFWIHPILSQSHLDSVISEKLLNREYYIFGENVNLRKEPNQKSDVVLQLQPGDSITILEKATKLLSLKDTKGHWYRVKTLDKQGYVWGPLLADSHITLQGVLVLFHNGGPNTELLEIKSIREKRILSFLSLKPGLVANENWSFNIYDSNLFEPNPGTLFGFRFSIFSDSEFSYPIEKIFSLSRDGIIKDVYTWYPGNCDLPNCHEAYLVFPGKTLTADPSIQRQEYKGSANSILQVNRNYDTEDKTNNLYHTITSSWNGKTFVKK